MAYINAILIVGLFGFLVVFFWKRSMFGPGRALEKHIAAHTGIPKNVLHLLLVHGASSSSDDTLAELEKSGLALDQASIAIAPQLALGIKRMEERFGPQEMVDKVKPIVAKLVAEHEKKQ